MGTGADARYLTTVFHEVAETLIHGTMAGNIVVYITRSKSKVGTWHITKFYKQIVSIVGRGENLHVGPLGKPYNLVPSHNFAS